MPSSKVLKSVAEVVKEAIKKADAEKAVGKTKEILESQTPPATTPRGGPLLPRSQGMYPPDVPQVDLPRQKGIDKARAEGKKPKYTERMQSLLDSPTVRKKVDKLIAKGQDLGMKEWYGTEPLRQAALDVISPQQYESLMAQLASASQRNPVDQQNLMGSYLYYLQQQGRLDPDALLLTNKLKEQGIEGIEAPLIELPEGYGSLAQSAIFNRGKQIAAGDIEGALPPEKKLGTFYRNLLGNLQPVTVDVNAVRGPVIEAGDPRWLASKLVEKDEAGKVKNVYFPRQMVEEGKMSVREAKERPGFWEAAPSGSEYAGFEDLWQRAARREGVRPAEAQALGWYGSGDVTALKTKPELYIENLERLLSRTADVTGKSPLEVLRQFLKGEEFLRKAEGGSIDLEAEYQMGRAGGGFVRKAMKAIQKAAESADVKMTPAVKDLTTIEDTHTNLMDSVRDRAAQMQRTMEGFDYKYKPGEYVFFADSTRKNLPPARIVRQHLSGNQPMREPVPEGTPRLSGKVIKDPKTGRAMRTPYEPGYVVRMERGPDDWQEFTVPETGIMGRVDPDEPYAKGGAVMMNQGGNPDVTDSGRIDLNAQYEMSKGGAIMKALEAVKEAVVPAVSRIDMSYKDVTKRVPELTDAAKKVASGEMSPAEYDALVNKVKPVAPYEFVPKPATPEEAVGALSKDKAPRYGKTADIEPGEVTDLRLDIPAYSQKGVWVNSIHRKGAPTVYGSVSSVKNATMIGAPEKAMKVATGETPKAPFAVIRGEWQPMDETEAVTKAQEYLKHPEWVQVGYDPERHGYFYNRSTMQPVAAAEEVIQIGPLVLAKKPTYAEKAKQKFADGGGAEGMTLHKMANGGAAIMKRGGKAKGETLASMDTGKVETRRAPGAEKAEKILSGAAELLPGVAAGKSAIEGEYQKALIEAGLDVAGGPIAKGLGAAIPAVAGIFIGPKSKLWDKTAAKEFAKLEKAGASPQEAWQQTGTFRSPDGILRQEISDQPSRLRRERMMDLEDEYAELRKAIPQYDKELQASIQQGEITEDQAIKMMQAKQDEIEAQMLATGKEYGRASKLATPGQLIRRQDPNLAQTLYHPELFKAYPQLKHIRTEYRVDPSARPRGHLTVGQPLPWSSSNAPSMLSVAETTPEARNIILHEAQHGIQRIENMGLGGNPAREWGMLPSEMHAIDYVQRLEQSKEGLLRQLDDLAKQAPEGGWDLKSGEMHPRLIRSGAIIRRIKNTEDAIRAAKQGEHHPLYHRMAGEAEARAVQKRMTYGPERRKEMFPLDEYDVPIDQLVVRTEPYANGGAVMMADGGDPESPTLREMGQPRYSTERKGTNAFKFTKDVLENLYQMAKRQAAEELKTTDSRAITDVANNIIADTVGAPVDMVNMAMQSFGVGSERPVGGSQQMRDLMREYEMTSGVERPLTETLLSIAGPGAVAKGPRAAERALNVGTAAVRRPFTPVTVTTEAVAPDLAKTQDEAFKQYVTKQLLGEGDVKTLGGRPVTQRPGQGVYLNTAGQLELNPMMGFDVPVRGSLGKSGKLMSDIATLGVGLGQESMAAHRFIPMATNQIKDATAMLIKGPGGKPLSNEEVIALGKRLPDMVVTHSPRLGGLLVAPFSMTKGAIPQEFLQAQSVANEVLGKGAKIQYGRADQGKDLMYMTQDEYATSGAREPSAEILRKRAQLKRMEQSLPAGRRSSAAKQAQDLPVPDTTD